MHQGFIVIHIFEINLSIFEMHINVFVGRKLISGSFDLTHRQTDRQTDRQITTRALALYACQGLMSYIL